MRPSDAHERRVELIEDIATLAGFHRRFPLGLTIEPDVVRADRRRKRILVGDAKATETPGRTATYRRLSSYAEAAREYGEVGWDVFFVLCHGAPWLAHGWCECLAQAISFSGQQPSSAGGGIIDEDATMAWAVVQSRRVRRGPPPRVSSRPWRGFPATLVDPCARSTSSAEQAA